ncbi:MAG: carboxypeptidase-like regulatory domain-containing protein [Pseudomonadota bacterium]
MIAIERTIISGLIAACFYSVYSIAAVAQDAQNIPSPTSSEQQAPAEQQKNGSSLEPKTENGITYVSGGVGEEEVQALKNAAKDYDLMVTFASGKTGAYLADVKVDIENAKGKNVLSAVSDGPIFLADLPKGTYRIKAEAEGKTVTRQVQVSGRHGQTKRTEMVWPERLVVSPAPEPTSSQMSSTPSAPSGNDSSIAAPTE